MAKKKATRGKSAKKKAGVKKSAARATKKKAAGKATSRKAAKKKAGGRKAAKKRTASTKRTAGKKAAAKSATSSAMPLGRPKVTLDSRIDLLFHKDLEIRETCEFLRVSTLRELEQLSPDEIITRLTAPVVQTVTRIRKALALRNRCLKGDEKFAKQFKDEVARQLKQARR